MNVYIDNLTIENMTISDYSTTSFFILNAIWSPELPMNVTLTNWKVKNVDLVQKNFVYANAKTDILIINNIEFYNIKLGASAPMFEFAQTNLFNIGGLTLNTVQRSAFQISEHPIIKITSLKLLRPSDSSLTNIHISNTENGFFSLVDVEGSTVDPRLVTVKNFTYTDTEFSSQADLLDFSKIQTTQNFQIQLSQLSFMNLSFVIGGNLIKVQSQLSKGIVVQGLYISNTVGANIQVESFNKSNTDLPAKLLVTNMTTDNVNLRYSSLFLLNEGADVEIRQSDIKNVYSYETGAFMSAGNKGAVATIYDTEFYNNTAVEASLFHVQFSSVIKLYNCTIRNNFAIEAGIIKAASDGYFEFYNVTISQNYALTELIGNIFDSVNYSVLDNTLISDNKIISSAEMQTELNTRCTFLCFIPTDFKNYITASPERLVVIQTKHLFLNILGNLIIRNNSVIFNQDSLVNSYSSSLVISNSVIENLQMSQSGIIITGSQVTFENITIRNISPSFSPAHAFIVVSLGSTLSGTIIRFTDNLVPFLNMVDSTLSIDGLIMNEVISALYPIVIDQSNVDLKNSHIKS